jgi:ABC-2 type transport system ATP-binding protein
VAEPMIQVRGVSKDFMLPHLRQNTIKGHFVNVFRQGRVTALQHALCDIDFDVARGEFFGIIGRNGSGKSTLLKILAGIYLPTAGDVTVGGRLVPFIELGVGFNLELTGRENVYLNGALLGFSKNQVDEMYDDIVAFAELEEFMDQKLKNYSSGMQVRLAFSVATRAKADVLLIDEVLAVGDAAFQRKCFEHFRALKKSDTTIVFVTHDMGSVREFCDRVILIEDSRVIAEGGAEDVARQYTQLFTPPAHEAQAAEFVQTIQNRWGEGHARYEGVRVPELITDQHELVLDLEAVAERDVEEAVYGFVISDSSGTQILGTSSLQKRQECGGLAKGERVRIQWSVPNVFSDGLHYLEVAITDRRGLVVYDSWKQAASFRVLKEESTPYLVTPDVSFSFARTDASHSPTAHG